jgi:outer membrane protein assembly factor BamB
MSSPIILRGVMLLFALTLGAACVSADDWTAWRGPNSDNKVTGFKAPATWPKELKKKWSENVGIGESSPLLLAGKIYTFGRQSTDEVIRCSDATSGKEIWVYKVPAEKVPGPGGRFPGSRSTPVVGEGKVCSLGADGTVTCVDAASGKLVWTDNKNPVRPQFSTSTSPLIADGKCIVFSRGLMAYDLADGSIKWKWGAAAQIPFGSPVLMTVDGVKTVVTPSKGALVGVGLADGKELWKVSIGPGGGDYFHHYSTPLVDGKTVIYSITGSKGANANTIALKIEKNGGELKATEVWNVKRSADKYHTPTSKEGRVYGVTTGKNFFCLDAKSGKELWVDKSSKNGDCGAILDVGSVLLAISSTQDLIAFKASSSKFEEVARYRVGTDETWCVPIVDGNRIYVKDKAGALTMYTME